MTHVFNKPFLKWLGGKSEICEDITNHFPTRCSSFHDVFLGSGSVLIHVLHLVRDRSLRCDGPICAYDANTALISTFKNIQIACDDLVRDCMLLQENYNNSSNKSDMYYHLRGTYNSLLDKTATYASALFIFLNKTCFRGIYRESRKSGFNVPFGNYMKVKLLDPGHAEHLSVIFREVRFYTQSYEVTLRSLDKDALVYLDPPYMPLKPDSFVKYTNDGFSWKDHHNLFHIVARLHHSGVFFVMSNSSVEDVMVVFENFVIERIVCKRKITPKKPNANCVELLITNANKHFGEDTNGAISFPAIL